MVLISPHRRDSKSDQRLAAFLNELRSQSLESFETFTYNSLGPECFLALSCHEDSLIVLRLNMLSSSILLKISLLKGCTKLVSLSLAGDGQNSDDLEKSHNDSFLEILAWLKDCKKLRILAFTSFPSAAALMALILLEKSIHLTPLEYEGFVEGVIREFHRELANQTSLQSLCLKGFEADSLLEADVVVGILSSSSI